MSVLCTKRSYTTSFEHQPHLIPSIFFPPSKRTRCYSPPHVSPPPALVTSPIDHQLRSSFPDFDHQLLVRAHEASSNDLDGAIKNMNNLQSTKMGLDCGDKKSSLGVETKTRPSHEGTSSEWVELFVREMCNSSNMDDARVRASRLLETVEKLLVDRGLAESLQNQKEILMLKEQVKQLDHDNGILKRGIRTLHDRNVEFERTSQEIVQLKKVQSGQNEELQKLRLQNYELKLRLVREQCSNPIPGRILPDVF